MPEALARLPGPGGDALEFLVVGRGKQFVAALEGVREPGGAKVVGLADQKGRLEFGVGAELVHRFEQTPAQRQVLGLDLFLQRNRVSGDNHLPRLVHRVEDARHEVGQTLADAGAGFKEQNFIVGH